jgi:hypothetical protein
MGKFFDENHDDEKSDFTILVPMITLTIFSDHFKIEKAGKRLLLLKARLKLKTIISRFKPSLAIFIL